MATAEQVQIVKVEQDQNGQRLDNFLIRRLKGVPRSRIYRLIRRGEVRVNKKRCKPEQKLDLGDQVRIPPYTGSDTPTPGKPTPGLQKLLSEAILYEDADLLVINKPAGLAVHGGSGIRLGIIEALRQMRPEWKRLELVHRLDRDTSGVLLIAKQAQLLKYLQDQFRAKTVQKRYLALVHGQWPDTLQEIDAPLIKNEVEGGERIVRISPEGKAALTRFAVKARYRDATLLQVSPQTGRTHQIRVHCQHGGHAIVGDPKYDSPGASGPLKRVKYLCLHAETLQFQLPGADSPLELRATLDPQFEALVKTLDKI